MRVRKDQSLQKDRNTPVLVCSENFDYQAHEGSINYSYDDMNVGSGKQSSVRYGMVAPHWESPVEAYAPTIVADSIPITALQIQSEARFLPRRLNSSCSGFFRPQTNY